MFCDWLKNSRETLGLTQRQMAPLVNLSASALGMYEQGRRRPGPAAQARLRAFFARHGLTMPPPPRRQELPAKKRFRELLRRTGREAPR